MNGNSSLNLFAAASLIVKRSAMGHKFLGTVAEESDGRQAQHLSSALMRVGMGLDTTEIHGGRRFLFAFPRFESARSCPPDLTSFMIVDDPTYQEIGRVGSHPPKGMSIEELCRAELISEIQGSAGRRQWRSYRSTNADESHCDVTVSLGPVGRSAFCLRHQKSNDCEGAARVLCVIDYERRYGRKQIEEGDYVNLAPEGVA